MRLGRQRQDGKTAGRHRRVLERRCQMGTLHGVVRWQCRKHIEYHGERRLVEVGVEKREYRHCGKPQPCKILITDKGDGLTLRLSPLSSDISHGIPWDCILEVKAYSYPWYKFKGRDGDETLCLTYKNAKGKTKKVRFGLLLNKDQQEIVIERIKELCVKNFGKK